MTGDELMKASCKLCYKIAKLKKSHILPEFLYLPTYDGKHRAVKITSTIGGKEDYIQKGLREYLLCEHCEAQFSRYETYAAPIIKSIPSLLPDPSGQFVVISYLDYSLLKLFQISLLWRASVAKSPAFAAIDLGEHEKTLRRMLLDENPGQPDEYGCMMIVIQNTKYLERLMWSPVHDIIDGNTCFRFLTGGIFWYFFLDRSYPTATHDFFLAKSGVLKILISPWSESQIVSRIAGPIAEKKSRQKTMKGIYHFAEACSGSSLSQN